MLRLVVKFVLLSLAAPAAMFCQEPIQVSVCELTTNPATYNGSLIRVRGTYKAGTLSSSDLLNLRQRCEAIPLAFTSFSSLQGRTGHVTIIGRVQLTASPQDYRPALRGKYHAPFHLLVLEELDLNLDEMKPSGSVIAARH